MFDQIAQVVARYDVITQQMSSPEISADYTRLTELAQERSEIEPLVLAYREHAGVVQELEDTREMLDAGEGSEMRQMIEDEIERLENQQDELEQQMRTLLLPKDPRDDRNVFIEIRAGTGGDEAALFAADLLRMYTRYAEGRNWKPEIVDENFIGVGGYKEVILSVKGNGAYSRLKFESGVHRVQRVPVTESQGRIHTSAATVAVMPEVDDVDITLNERDLEVTSTFASGPGGQHMQKNATAARVVHKPSGIAVKVQTERSLSQNKQVAFAIIQARLQEMEEDKQHAAIAADRKAQVGSGDRSEKIRTYNYPQSRVTDHRVNYSSYNLQAVIDGDLDPFIDRLILADEAEKLATIEQG
jgi:peptide chain release factor 1